MSAEGFIKVSKRLLIKNTVSIAINNLKHLKRGESKLKYISDIKNIYYLTVTNLHY